MSRFQNQIFMSGIYFDWQIISSSPGSLFFAGDSGFSLDLCSPWSEPEPGIWSPGVIPEGLLCGWRKQWSLDACCWGHGWRVCERWGTGPSPRTAASWAGSLDQYWGNLQFTSYSLTGQFPGDWEQLLPAREMGKSDS